VRLVDTNVFIRAITNDDLRASVLAQALFGRLENGPEDALVTEAVVAEVVYVLSSTAFMASPGRKSARGSDTFLACPGLWSTTGRIVSERLISLWSGASLAL
jgi:predicted nucleic acid-binding protein